MLKFLRQQEIALPPVPILAATNVDSRLTDYLQQLHSALTENNRLQQTKVEQFDYNTLVNEATPSVISYYKHSYWVTGGTTTITNFDQGYHGQVITVIAEHSVTITHGTNIILNSGSNKSMVSGDTLSLIFKSNDKWYELFEGGGVSSLLCGGLYYSGDVIALSDGVDTVVPYNTIISGFSDGIESATDNAIVIPATGWYDIHASAVLKITSSGEVDNWFNIVRCDTPKQAYPNYDDDLIKKFRRLAAGTDEDWWWADAHCVAHLTKDHYVYATISSNWPDSSPSYISDFYGDTKLTIHQVR